MTAIQPARTLFALAIISILSVNLSPASTWAQDADGDSRQERIAAIKKRSLTARRSFAHMSGWKRPS